MSSTIRKKMDEHQKTNLDLFISATSWLVGLSVGFTVGALVKQNVETENKRQDVELYVGTAAVSWVTKEIVRDKFEKRVYKWVDSIREAKKEAEEEIASKNSKGK